jgi:TRAP-type C4-dicarboxylate transport system permease small subunit
MNGALGRGLGRTLEWILISLMVGLTTLVVVAVIFRKSGASLSFYDEVASVLLAWITYYGSALAALRRKHIGFDAVLLSIPMPVRMWFVVIGEVLVIGFFILMAWAGLRVLDVLQGESLVSLTWVPVELTQSVIPVGAILFIIAELLSLPAYWRQIATGQSSDH